MARDCRRAASQVAGRAEHGGVPVRRVRGARGCWCGWDARMVDGRGDRRIHRGGRYRVRCAGYGARPRAYASERGTVSQHQRCARLDARTAACRYGRWRGGGHMRVRRAVCLGLGAPMRGRADHACRESQARDWGTRYSESAWASASGQGKRARRCRCRAQCRRCDGASACERSDCRYRGRARVAGRNRTRGRTAAYGGRLSVPLQTREVCDCAHNPP